MNGSSFSPTAADGDHHYFLKPPPQSNPVREFLAPFQSFDLEVRQVVEEDGGRTPCWTSGMPRPAGGGPCGPGAVFGVAMCVCVCLSVCVYVSMCWQGGVGRCALTLPVAAEGAGQSGRHVWHLHGQGVGQAGGGRAALRHPAQLQPRPLPGLPACLAEEPRGLPARCHQVRVLEKPAGSEAKAPRRGGLVTTPLSPSTLPPQPPHLAGPVPSAGSIPATSSPADSG